jgi:hypothetical protein
VSAGSQARNPDLRCARLRSVDGPACGHKRSEHSPKNCFGVIATRIGAVDCWCPRFVEPGDSEPVGRQQEQI